MLTALGILLAVVGLALAASAFAALVRARLFRFAFRGVLALLMLVAGAVLTVLSLGVQGLQALSHEESAAHIKLEPTGPQHFDAVVTFPDGMVRTYAIAGDDLYVDGHIVKWTPLANMLGLQTSYRLDRISGRYRSLEQETTAERTVYAIGTPPKIDLVALGRMLPLAPFFDAEYGSASYVPAAEGGELDLRVSTTGLLLRPAAPRP
jgi:hypothetical protein